MADPQAVPSSPDADEQNETGLRGVALRFAFADPQAHSKADEKDSRKSENVKGSSEKYFSQVTIKYSTRHHQALLSWQTVLARKARLQEEILEAPLR